MFKIIVGIIVVLVAAVLLYATTKPDAFRVQRTALIKAPPEKIFPLINDFKQWGAWSPCEKKDPTMQRTFGATTSGPGAKYAWNGNKNVGQGSMEIQESAPPSKIVLKLDFVKPMEGHNVVEFTLQPVNDGTRVTWDMQGPTPYLAKIIHVFFDMDRMVGGDFETGLANLKASAEK